MRNNLAKSRRDEGFDQRMSELMLEKELEDTARDAEAFFFGAPRAYGFTPSDDAIEKHSSKIDEKLALTSLFSRAQERGAF